MPDQVIVIDYDKCTGCRICELACSLLNTGAADPGKSRVRIVKIEEEANCIPIPVICMKCVDPACKAVCPMGAISDSPLTGARVIDDNKCIGCSACVYACPFGAIAVDRSLGHSYTCNHCEGDPTCVKFCPTGAMEYVDNDEVSIRLRRSALNRYVDFVRDQAE
jgi:carbon-monoxide dehydrogenase iron sulfur subunit